MAAVSLLFMLASVGLSLSQVIRNPQGTASSKNSMKTPSNEDVYSALVQVSIRCKNDPYNGLTCAAEYPDQCKERWNFPNPCTKNNLQMNINRFVHPLDKTKFLMCAQVGKLYVVQCPQHEVFHDRCGECREPGDTSYCSGSGSSGGMGSSGINTGDSVGGTGKSGSSSMGNTGRRGSDGGMGNIGSSMGNTGLSDGAGDMGNIGRSSMGNTDRTGSVGGMGNSESSFKVGIGSRNSGGGGGIDIANLGISIDGMGGIGGTQNGGKASGSLGEIGVGNMGDGIGGKSGETILQALPYDICTKDAILANKLFFPYPGNLSKFIHCDVWGKPWERICTPGEVWSSLDITCVLPHLLNPCNRPSTKLNYLYTHPCDQTKYLTCDSDGRAHEINCARDEAFNETTQQCHPYSFFTDTILTNYCGNYNFGFLTGNTISPIVATYADNNERIKALSQQNIRNRDSVLFKSTGGAAADTKNRGSKRNNQLGRNTNSVGNIDGTSAFDRTTQVRSEPLTRQGDQFNSDLLTGLLNDGVFASNRDGLKTTGFNGGISSNLVDSGRKSLSSGPGIAEFVDIRSLGTMGTKGNIIENTGNTISNGNNMATDTGRGGSSISNIDNTGILAKDISGSIFQLTDHTAGIGGNTERSNNGALNIVYNDITGTQSSNTIGQQIVKRNTTNTTGHDITKDRSSHIKAQDVKTQTVTSDGGTATFNGKSTGFGSKVGTTRNRFNDKQRTQAGRSGSGNLNMPIDRRANSIILDSNKLVDKTTDSSNVGGGQLDEILNIGGQGIGIVNGRTLGRRSDIIRGVGTSSSGSSGSDTMAMNDLTKQDSGIPSRGQFVETLQDLINRGSQQRLSNIATFDLKKQLGIDGPAGKRNAISGETGRTNTAHIDINQINGKDSRRDVLTSWDQIIGAETAGKRRNTLNEKKRGQGGKPAYLTTDTMHPSRLRTYAFSNVKFREPCTRENIEAGRTHFRLEGFPHQFLQCDTAGKMHRMPCSGKDWFDVYTNTCVDGPIHVSNNAIKTT